MCVFGFFDRVFTISLHSEAVCHEANCTPKSAISSARSVSLVVYVGQGKVSLMKKVVIAGSYLTKV